MLAYVPRTFILSEFKAVSALPHLRFYPSDGPHRALPCCFTGKKTSCQMGKRLAMRFLLLFTFFEPSRADAGPGAVKVAVVLLGYGAWNKIWGKKRS